MAGQIKVDLEDNANEVLKALEDATNKALYVMGNNAVKETVLYMSKPDFTGKDIVDTGRLRASISFVTPVAESGPNGLEASGDDFLKGKAPNNVAYVGSNVEYATYVNNGTKKQPARNFLQHGINNSKLESERQIKLIFEGKL